MTSKITFHGVACYEVQGDFGTALFDPFFDGNPAATIGAADVAPPDVILVSHAASDHMADAAKIALRTGAPVVCGIDTAELLQQAGVPTNQIRRTIWGIRVRVGGLDINPVECHHWSQSKLKDGTWVSGTPLSFVVRTCPDTNIYHFGDSAIFSDLELIARLHQPNVGLIGCSQPWSILTSEEAGEVTTGEMNPEEAALAAEFLSLKYAVACHYENTKDPAVAEFLDRVNRSTSSADRVGVALEPGQTLVINSDGHAIV